MPKQNDVWPTEAESCEGRRAAVWLARKGGKARAAKLSPKRRREIARMAALARWSKARKGGKPKKRG